MATPTLDVVGIGNAIVDVHRPGRRRFLAAGRAGQGHDDADRRDARRGALRKMGPGIEASGGSAGNTMAGIASLGGKGAYIGKVRDDQLGEVFRHDMRRNGVRFETPPADGRPGTARCLILVTPDAQRTMNTYPRRLRRARPERHRRRADASGAGHLSRRLSVRSAAREGGVPQGRRGRARGRPARSR